VCVCVHITEVSVLVIMGGPCGDQGPLRLRCGPQDPASPHQDPSARARLLHLALNESPGVIWFLLML